MTGKDDSVRQEGWAGAQVAVPDDVAAALPVAALITSIIKNTEKSYTVVYHSKNESAEEGSEKAGE